jgi:hypothetical protein
MAVAERDDGDEFVDDLTHGGACLWSLPAA